MPRLIEHDAFTGLTEIYHKTDKGFAIQTRQDCSKILESNKIKRANDSGNWKGDWHEIAAIPHIVIMQWHKELGDDPLAKRNRKWFINKLKDFEYSKLRTKGGRL